MFFIFLLQLFHCYLIIVSQFEKIINAVLVRKPRPTVLGELLGMYVTPAW